MSKKILGSIIVILIIAVGFYYQSQLSDDDGVKKVGFIYVGPVTDFGWTYEHDQGRKAVVEAFGEAVETTYGESVSEGPDAERAITQMARDHDLIFTTSFGYMNPTIKVAEKFKKVKLSQALKHPKWKMGKKITIDSSTLMNKIFEVVEAQKIFNLSSNLIDIIIHPNSLVHAILELKNGLKKFIYHETTMIIPLANAIFDGKLDINVDGIKKSVGITRAHLEEDAGKSIHDL